MNGARTMVLAERRMDPALALVVREACGRAAIDCYSWNGIDRVDDLAGRAALALGVLPAGVRRIPGELSGLVTDQLPGLPLVLVAEEPLVRPVVSLHDGLITLLESPLTVARLASCARGLLSERVPTSGAEREWWPLGALHADGEAVERCGYQAGPCWIGGLDCAGPEGGPARSVPWLRTDRGVAAMLAPTGWLPPDRSDEPADPGIAGCMVELELGADRPRWIFHRAGPGDVVGLYSAQRLPRWTELGSRSRSHAEPIRIPAAVGDVVVLFTPAPPWVVDPAAPGHPVGEGGPALLDAFEMELRRAPMPFACLVIDLR